MKCHCFLFLKALVWHIPNRLLLLVVVVLFRSEAILSSLLLSLTQSANKSFVSKCGCGIRLRPDQREEKKVVVIPHQGIEKEEEKEQRERNPNLGSIGFQLK
jgi:ferredoxin-thioredoxin reductase catalytic subunit